MFKRFCHQYTHTKKLKIVIGLLFCSNELVTSFRGFWNNLDNHHMWWNSNSRSSLWKASFIDNFTFFFCYFFKFPLHPRTHFYFHHKKYYISLSSVIFIRLNDKVSKTNDFFWIDELWFHTRTRFYMACIRAVH